MSLMAAGIQPNPKNEGTENVDHSVLDNPGLGCHRDCGGDLHRSRAGSAAVANHEQEEPVMYQVNYYYLNPLRCAGPCKDEAGAIIRYDSLDAATVAALRFNREYRPRHGVYSAAIDPGMVFTQPRGTRANSETAR
jgi:hypothetical protein